MSKLGPLAIVALAFASGCAVYDYDDDTDPSTVVIVHEDPPDTTPVFVNYAPLVETAEAGVYWDDYLFDDIWYFDATADDANGVYDVVQVWADVYDEWNGGVYVQSFELFPTDDPYYWYSDWYGSTTFLDPFYGGYTVDIVAYDALDAYGWVTIWPYTYVY